MTKDIDFFVESAHLFPYLFTVPFNTAISAIFLFNMFGAIIIVCYLIMAGLLVMQYFTNKYIATL